MLIKLKNLKQLQDDKTIFTSGAFDILHVGHIAHFRYIKECCPNHKLVVGVLSDKRIRVKKGAKRPIMSESQRLAMIDAIKYVDYSFIVPTTKKGGDNTLRIVNLLKPEYVAVLPYWKKREKKLINTNTKLIISKIGPRQSSTKIIEKIVKLFA